MGVKLTTLDQFTMLANRCKTEIGKVEAKIPTALSQLTNDLDLVTEDDVIAAVNSAGKMGRTIVSSLSDVDKNAPGAENYIYMVPSSDTPETDGYTEYMLIGGKFDPIGTTTSVDLDGYLKDTDAATDAEVTAALNAIFQTAS